MTCYLLSLLLATYVGYRVFEYGQGLIYGAIGCVSSDYWVYRNDDRLAGYTLGTYWFQGMVLEAEASQREKEEQKRAKANDVVVTR